jgi:glycosyltransferase involved in cell wall biosynthesis
MKLFQINVIANSGSTGRIAEDIGRVAISKGWQSYIAYGRWANASQSELIRIGNRLGILWHGVVTRLFDRHGLASRCATKKLIRRIKQIKPDIIHLHNVHGYFLNYKILFRYLASVDTPVIWTFHDCWPFTGHCAHFTYKKCNKWKTACVHCPEKGGYPASWLVDNSKQNYRLKKKYFNAVPNLTIVPVSYWLGDLVKKSFLQSPIKVIHNGIDLNVFKPTSRDIRHKYGIGKETCMILGVASVWTSRKGLYDFMRLATIIPSDWQIVLVGLSAKQIRALPEGVIGIERTENINELAALYSAADVFVNPTWEDNYPTTNLEAISCGTPTLTYRTGGSVESVTPETGAVVQQGDIQGVYDAVEMIHSKGKAHYSDICRSYAETHFDKNKCFEEYFKLYQNSLPPTAETHSL